LTANSDRLSHFGRRMSLFQLTLILGGILSTEQEHRQEHVNLGGRRRRAARALLKTAAGPLAQGS
jgi:hypothetical protein